MSREEQIEAAEKIAKVIIGQSLLHVEEAVSMVGVCETLYLLAAVIEKDSLYNQLLTANRAQSIRFQRELKLLADDFERDNEILAAKKEQTMSNWEQGW